MRLRKKLRVRRKYKSRRIAESDIERFDIRNAYVIRTGRTTNYPFEIVRVKRGKAYLSGGGLVTEVDKFGLPFRDAKKR